MNKQITIVNDDLDVPYTNEGSVLEILLKSEIPIDHSCGGMGSCGTCRILIQSNLEDLPSRNEVEQERATDLGFKDHERLACQLCPLNKLKIQIP